MRAHCQHVGIQSDEDMVTCVYCGHVLAYSNNPRPASYTARGERVPAVGKSLRGRRTMADDSVGQRPPQEEYV